MTGNEPIVPVAERGVVADEWIDAAVQSTLQPCYHWGAKAEGRDSVVEVAVANAVEDGHGPELGERTAEKRKRIADVEKVQGAAASSSVRHGSHYVLRDKTRRQKKDEAPSLLLNTVQNVLPTTKDFAGDEDGLDLHVPRGLIEVEASWLTA